jgi:FAD/FMN-containing dehydrogenase
MLRFQGPIEVNDIHSALNRTSVATIHVPQTNSDLIQLVQEVRTQGESMSVSGNRHAMGGQQFLSQAHLVDMRSMNKMISFNMEKSTATIQAGANWQDVLQALKTRFQSNGQGLSFRQKQTGADNLSLGGAVAVNAHGRGLKLQAFVSEVESLRVITARGELINCSRSENAELFSVLVGGYGLAGIVAEVELRLWPRHKVRRVVQVIEARELVEKVDQRIAAGYEYGDFQFRIDSEHPLFLQQGVFSCYAPEDLAIPISEKQAELSPQDWYKLLWLAHNDKKTAFERYSGYYLSTDNQVYWSDDHQMSTYLDGYHTRLDSEQRNPFSGSEMISELYVPRERIADFLQMAAGELRKLSANVIYGTVRFIEPDRESVLTWARERWACTIFNLHIDHTPAGMAAAQEQFRRLIDIAQSFGGSYFLTYHRWARREQILACHPRIREFLQLKNKYDPDGIFQSDWSRSLIQTLGSHNT